jgi:heterodisulfide reductase subunit A
MMTDKKVLIIGGGVAGLSAALDLAKFNIDVDLIEKSVFPGGHAIQFSCKATETCVKCGACMVEEKLADALEHPRITLHRGSQIEEITTGNKIAWTAEEMPAHIDPDACTNCGICQETCPVLPCSRRVGSRLFEKP